MQHEVKRDRRVYSSISQGKNLTFVLQLEKEKSFNTGTKIHNFRVTLK